MEPHHNSTDLLNDPIAWGRQLILTNDHDPLYVGLTNWNVKGSRLRRFMLAYWCCYSVGASWWLSERSGTRFWDALQVAAENVDEAPVGGRWPRAHERRHWRGQKCVDSVIWLRERFRHPEEAVLSLEPYGTLKEVNKAMSEWPQFGPWIAFKAADMLERVLGRKLYFPEELIIMYKDPKEAAHVAGEILNMSPEDLVIEMIDAYSDIPAPGYAGRVVNVQEVETVLCKWKSARGGHYRLGLDTQSHRAELAKWAAYDLLDAYPITPA